MATAFNIFDSSPANILGDLVTKITASTDWADVTPSWSITTTASTTTTQTTGWTTASTSQMYVGMPLKITVSSIDYYRRVTAITSGTQFSINAQLSVVTSSGQSISFGGKVLKATTTRGAVMAFSIGFDAYAFTGTSYPNRLYMQFFRVYGGSNPADFTDATGLRYIFWATNASNGTDLVHGVVSAGKEHVFISLEGPRSNETNTDSTSYGSQKNCMFMCDVAPYHVADTIPCVAAYARWSNGFADQATDTMVEISRNSANSASWVTAKMASLQYPGELFISGMAKLQRVCNIDSNEYLWPWVVVQDGEGLRGRLAKIFYAGSNFYNGAGLVESGENVGDVLTYDGLDYKLVTPTKNYSSSSNMNWSCFGFTQGINTQSQVGPVIAIPKT